MYQTIGKGLPNTRPCITYAHHLAKRPRAGWRHETLPPRPLSLFEWSE